MEKIIYDFVLEKCDCQWIAHEAKYSAFITLCGYDYQEYGETDFEAKNKLANELAKSKYIQKNFKPQ